MKVYNRIFGMQQQDTSGLLRMSVNDYVREQIKAMQKNPRISNSDKSRLDLHLTSIRDMEKKIARTLPEDKKKRLDQLAGGNALKDSNNDRLDQIIMLFMDIIALSIASGYVRGVNFQMLSGIDDTRFTIGNDHLPPAHGSSHREGGRGSDGDLLTLRKYEMFWAEAIAYLASQLNVDQINGKGLIDYGVILAATEIADGASHGEDNVPHMIVGSCNGALKVGHYSDYGLKLANNTLLASIGNAVGLKGKNSEQPMQEFGVTSKHGHKGKFDALLTKP